MRRISGPKNGSQQGFILIEVVVAIAITGLIGAGITMSAVQVMNVRALSTNHIIAVKQVESAAYWINRDVRMSQGILPGAGSGFPLNLSWVAWDNTSNNVSYEINDGQLRRRHSVNGTPPVQTAIAKYINSDPVSTNCSYSSGVFTFKVTASVNGFRPSSETRLIQVIPRSAP